VVPCLWLGIKASCLYHVSPLPALPMSLLRISSRRSRTSSTTSHLQLTPPPLSSCSHKLSALRYGMSSASPFIQLTFAALLNCPRRKTAGFEHGDQAHFHHSHGYSSRFVHIALSKPWIQTPEILRLVFCQYTGISIAFFAFPRH
jgi:hypothetical protein